MPYKTVELTLPADGLLNWLYIACGVKDNAVFRSFGQDCRYLRDSFANSSKSVFIFHLYFACSSHEKYNKKYILVVCYFVASYVGMFEFSVGLHWCFMIIFSGISIKRTSFVPRRSVRFNEVSAL